MNRIAIFHNLPSGGAKRSLYEWTKRLSKSSLIDLYIYGEHSEDFLDIREFCHAVYISKVPFLRRPWKGFRSKVFGFFTLVRESHRMAKEIDDRDYDWVFVQHDTYTQSPLVLRFLSTSSLYYCQEPFRRLESSPADLSSFQGWVDLILLKIDRWAARGSTIIACNSNYSKIGIQKAYGVTPEVLYLGVDSSLFSPIDNVASDNYVLSVGRAHPSKGHDFCIKSIGLLADSVRPKLVIMGDSTSDTEYVEYLHDLAKTKKVFLSIITVKECELSRLYSQAKAILCCQIAEPLGLSALEAICCHTYILGISEGGIVETVSDERVGRLVSRNVKIFANELNDFLSDDCFKYDHEFANNYIESKWTWDMSVYKILKLASQIEKNDKH